MVTAQTYSKNIAELMHVKLAKATDLQHVTPQQTTLWALSSICCILEWSKSPH